MILNLRNDLISEVNSSLLCRLRIAQLVSIFIFAIVLIILLNGIIGEMDLGGVNMLVFEGEGCS